MICSYFALRPIRRVDDSGVRKAVLVLVPLPDYRRMQRPTIPFAPLQRAVLP
jgi:hypothetical protein